ncbi:MAG TPA: hypothetical protein VGX28_14400 [Frankiaceae bacterium]|jgi:hypothetical protein|nr:hypothetical protein [Frankiaceae bacterium]
MRTFAAAALAVALAAAPSAAAPPPPSTWTVEVSGRAGEVVPLRVPSTARLGNGGGDTTIASAAPWSGVAITRLDAPPSRVGLDTYVHYGLRDALLCPGSRCEPPAWLQPTIAMDDDGNGFAVLTAGRYGIALLGPAGAPVTATIRFRGPRGARTALRTRTKAPAYSTTVFDPAVEQAGSTLASRGFVRFDPHGRHTVDSFALAFVLDAPAAVHHTVCTTFGGSRAYDGNVGGVAPCADFDGIDLVWGPDAYPVVPEPGGKAVGILFLGGAGRSPYDVGIGYEAEVAGVGGRIAAVHVAVAF